jgi:hypothetical protein
MTRTLHSLLDRAATLRIHGFPWEAVARWVNRSTDTCRSWPRRFPELWWKACREARDRAEVDPGALALATLRQLLQANDVKVQLRAIETALKILRPRSN